MNQTLDAFLDLCKATVVGQVGHLRYHPATLWISTGNRHPWVFAQLLEAERYAVSFTIKFEDFDIHLLSDFDDLARVLDTLPRHVCNVQQSINATQVNEGAVISEVFDHTLNGLALLQVLK